MKFLSVILLIVVGILIGVIFMSKCYVDVPTSAETIDYYAKRTIRDVRGYRYTIDSLRRVGVVPIIIPARVDTVEVYNVTYEIPVIPYTFQDSLPVRINQKLTYIPFTLTIDGYVGAYGIRTNKRQVYTGTIKKKTNWKLIGLSAAGIGILSLAILLLAK